MRRLNVAKDEKHEAEEEYRDHNPKEANYKAKNKQARHLSECKYFLRFALIVNQLRWRKSVLEISK